MSEIAGSQTLFVPEHERVSLDVNNLAVTVKSKDVECGQVTILDRVSFELPKNNIMAIMGGSGAGKTTLLNVLAQRLNVNQATMSFSGCIDYDRESKSAITTAYMQQEDVFLPGLTLRETLLYQAELRIPKVSQYERVELVDSLLQLLQLSHRSNEIVKSFTNHINLSGGEQRRTSLAIQLLNKPALLFLDEPTTGLDTTSALTLVKILRTLASPQIGITIILSIHQPRLEIAALFDKLCVLARGGRLIFCDALADASGYFRRLHEKNVVEKIEDEDPFATFNALMTMSVKLTRSASEEARTSRIVDSLVELWRHEHSKEYSLTQEQEEARFKDNMKAFDAAQPLPIWKEVYVLTRRTFKLSYRDRTSLLALNGMSLMLAIILGWVFYKPKADLAGIRSLTSCLYVVIEVLGFYPLLMELERLWAHDGVFFFKEYKEGCVSIPGFVISRRLGKLLLEDIPVSFLFCVVTYFMWGLRLGDNFNDSNDASYFGIFFAIGFLVTAISFTTGFLCFTLGTDFSISALISNAFYQLQNSGCGYFVNAATMPVYVRWVKYLAYFWYAFGALTANQYTNWEGDCPFPAGDERCSEYSGDYQLNVLGFPRNWIGEPIGILVAWYMGFNILSAICLSFRNYDMAVAKKKKNRIGGDDEDEKKLQDLSSEFTDDKERVEKESVSINVKKITLSVKVRESRSLLAKRVDRVLLDDVTADFKANAVNVIMGPSGGGKTTFLNFLADRLPKTSTFSRGGNIYLNNAVEVSPSEFSKIAAYVTQHDNLLIPQLTVRETLYYQAKLRLPVEEHCRIPSIITLLLRQTGLVDCADTPIGSATVKGISGGEKRRVSIAIQLLGKPKILFLDEPTSGLDTATSKSILTLLHELAEQGTTIILTIHQPSKEMFWQFDSMVLLARGGFVVYNGDVNGMPQYFEKLGYACPTTVNFADHVLDVVSKNPEESKDEAMARVNLMIQNWKKIEVANEKNSILTNDLDLSRYRPKSVPTWVAFKTVLHRTTIVSLRSVDVMFARVFQVCALGAIYAIFFAPLKNNVQGISDRLGLTQSVINLYFCGLLNNLGIYPYQRDLFHQEYKDSANNVFVFQSAYLLVELPFEFAPALFFSVLVVFGIGLPREAGMFFAMLLTSTVIINCGDSLGIICNSVFEHLGLATNILVNLAMVAIFMAGTMSLHMPPFFKAWNYLNPTKYAVQITTNLAFPGQHFACGNAPDCSLNTGDAVLDYYGLDAKVGNAIGALVGCIVIYRLIAVASCYVRVRWFV
uniref:ABC transporter domain-containing protein n=1 Tax=Candidozyma auris TaxID=498019 RepID=A0A0L0NS41_CANAR